MAQVEKLLAVIQSAEYLDAATKQNLLSQAKDLPAEKIDGVLDNFSKLALAAQKMEQKKDELAAKVVHVFRGLNDYSRRRVRKENLENAEQSATQEDQTNENDILKQIEDAA